MKTPARSVDVVVSFDTTGSMYPCLTQVRRRVKEMIGRLFREIPNLRVGIIAHGDYVDRNSTYVTRRCVLTTDQAILQQFISSVPATGGGDAAECYELVLHEARSFAWGTGTKTLILIGDDVPHPASDPQNTLHLDWRTEIEHLIKMGVNVYGVQALNRSHAAPFYEEIARRTGGFHLTLDQFSTVVDTVMAICYQQYDPEQVQRFESDLVGAGRVDRNLDRMFDVLLGRTAPSRRFRKNSGLTAVPHGRFQVLSVDYDQPINEFVRNNGLIFKVGRGFYQFTKTETIQSHKEVILRENGSGDFFTGADARKLMGLPPAGTATARGRFTIPPGYTVFVQSKSANRKLIGGTLFLYEVDRDR